MPGLNPKDRSPLNSNSFEVDLFEVEPYDDPYVRTPLEWCRSGLHWEDLGMLTWLRSHQRGFQFNEAFIIKASPAGRDKVRAILARLEKAGFLKRDKVRDEAGRIRGAKLTLRATADPVVAAMRAARQSPELRTENPSLDSDQHEHTESSAAEVLPPENPSEVDEQEQQGVSAGRQLQTGFPTPGNPQQRKNTIKEPPPPTPSVEGLGAIVARPEEAEERDETRTAAQALVAGLPGPLTAGQRHRLAETVTAFLAAGWTSKALIAELTVDLINVQSYSGLYQHRLSGLPVEPPAEVPAPHRDLPPLAGEAHIFEPDPADPESCFHCPRPRENRVHQAAQEPRSQANTRSQEPGSGYGSSDVSRGRSGGRGSGPIAAGQSLEAVLAAAGVDSHAA